MKHLVFIVLILFLGANSLAQSYVRKDSVLEEPFIYFSVGSFFPTINTALRVDTDAGLGTEISLEDNLNMNSQASVFKSTLIMRASPKSQFLFSLTGIDRQSSFFVEDTLAFQGKTYPVGVNARLFFNTRFYAFTWRYSIWNKPNWNAGLSVGARAIGIHTGMDAVIQGSSINESVRIAAPAILFGLHGSAYLTDRLLGRYSFDYLHFTIFDIDIRVLETNASLEYFIFKNVGIGGSYSVNEYSIREIPFSSDFQGKVIFQIGGFNLFATLRW